MNPTAILAAAAALSISMIASADARPRHLPAGALIQTSIGYPSAEADPRYSASSVAATAGKERQIAAVGEGSLIPHPSGCPRTSFCACGAAVRVFGSAIRDLWPASAWYRFPRTSPAPGTVAVRSHHVFVLESHISGSDWEISDYNSGGHLSRRWVRSISGYTIVDPHGTATTHSARSHHRRYAAR